MVDTDAKIMIALIDNPPDYMGKTLRGYRHCVSLRQAVEAEYTTSGDIIAPDEAVWPALLENMAFPDDTCRILIKNNSYRKPGPFMLNDFTGADKVYIACGYTDLRKRHRRPGAPRQQQFELDPFTNTLSLFCGRRQDRIKGLVLGEGRLHPAVQATGTGARTSGRARNPRERC